MKSIRLAAQPRRAALAAAVAVAFGLPATAAHAATSILFIGNSFTYGALASVQTYGADTVTDLNGTGIGGVPATTVALTGNGELGFDSGEGA